MFLDVLSFFLDVAARYINYSTNYNSCRLSIRMAVNSKNIFLQFTSPL